MSLVLGIDPGSRVTGYGVIDVQGNRLSYVDCGCIRSEGDALPARLKKISDGVSQLVETHQPSQVAIEEVFVGRNAASALKLGQARGAAIVACLQFKLEVSEYSARQVKQAVVGTGAAQKVQVQHMVKALLGISDTLAEDAADALAVAICHTNTQRYLIGLAGAKSFSRRRLR
ncbi:MAG: crossover junction endodeoxyribonuclease RuvC [Pseudomonadota bacterium]|nr:crossover junction endodeoxyribonuclease RuvC [Pseudomonadota bacterium]